MVSISKLNRCGKASCTLHISAHSYCLSYHVVEDVDSPHVDLLCYLTACFMSWHFMSRVVLSPIS